MTTQLSFRETEGGWSWTWLYWDPDKGGWFDYSDNDDPCPTLEVAFGTARLAKRRLDTFLANRQSKDT